MFGRKQVIYEDDLYRRFKALSIFKNTRNWRMYLMDDRGNIQQLWFRWGRFAHELTDPRLVSVVVSDQHSVANFELRAKLKRGIVSEYKISDLFRVHEYDCHRDLNMFD